MDNTNCTKENELSKKEVKAILKNALKITKKVLMYASIVLCAALLALTSWFAVSKYILKNKVPSFFGYSILVVSTGSMNDTLVEDDLILIKDTGDYITGDIVTFIHDGEKTPTTHRIVEYTDDGKYITRGDANNTDDRKIVSDDMIFGEVVYRMHTLGMIFGWLIDGGGYIYVISALVIIGFGVFLLKDDKERHLVLKDENDGEENAEKIDSKNGEDNAEEK